MDKNDRMLEVLNKIEKFALPDAVGAGLIVSCDCGEDVAITWYDLHNTAVELEGDAGKTYRLIGRCCDPGARGFALITED